MGSVPLTAVVCGGSVAAARWKNWRKAGALCSSSRANTPKAAADQSHDDMRLSLAAVVSAWQNAVGNCEAEDHPSR